MRKWCGLGLLSLLAAGAAFGARFGAAMAAFVAFTVFAGVFF